MIRCKYIGDLFTTLVEKLYDVMHFEVFQIVKIDGKRIFYKVVDDDQLFYDDDISHFFKEISL